MSHEEREGSNRTFVFQLFFILRKKNQHVSTLHVIHHGVMPFSVWMGVKFAPGGHSTFFALLNTFVHIIMYFYYMVAAMGPQFQKYIWWKKYLTTFQMVQTATFILCYLEIRKKTLWLRHLSYAKFLHSHKFYDFTIFISHLTSIMEHIFVELFPINHVCNKRQLNFLSTNAVRYVRLKYYFFKIIAYIYMGRNIILVRSDFEYILKAAFEMRDHKTNAFTNIQQN